MTKKNESDKQIRRILAAILLADCWRSHNYDVESVKNTVDKICEVFK